MKEKVRLNLFLCPCKEKRQNLEDGGSLRENGIKVLEGKSGMSVKVEKEEVEQEDWADLSRGRNSESDSELKIKKNPKL